MTLQSTQPLALSASTLIGDKLDSATRSARWRRQIMIDIYQSPGDVAYIVVSFGCGPRHRQ